MLFVAVNSGTSPAEFEGYLQRNNVTWPAISDWDRSFEKQFGSRSRTTISVRSKC